MWWPDRLRPGALAARALLAVAAVLPAACGFHLRGDVEYPPSMAVTYIEATDRYTPFYRQLKTTLRQGGVQVAGSPAGAGAVLRILQDETGQRVLSVSARNTPNEYDVYYVVRWSLEVAGKAALPAQQLVLTRDYTYDETRVLGKDDEATVIREALAADLVGVVSRRLASVR